MLSNSRNQRFHLRLADCGIHASKLQTLPAADPGMADNGNPAIEQTLPQHGIKAIHIEPLSRRNIAKNHRAETGSMNKLQCRLRPTALAA